RGELPRRRAAGRHGPLLRRQRRLGEGRHHSGAGEDSEVLRLPQAFRSDRRPARVAQSQALMHQGRTMPAMPWAALLLSITCLVGTCLMLSQRFGRTLPDRFWIAVAAAPAQLGVLFMGASLFHRLQPGVVLAL